MSSFKKFWKDYWDLCIKSMKFCKEHWIGLTIFCVIYAIAYLIVFFPYLIEIIWDEIKKKFSKKEDVED